jgi:hypothetical protein
MTLQENVRNYLGNGFKMCGERSNAFFGVMLLTTWGQFHQRSTHSFYGHKLRAELFCAYVLGLYFTGARLLVQKLRVEHW